MPKFETNALFMQAINVINRSLDAHKDEMPYKQILALSGKLLDDKKIGVAVYENNPNEPFDYYTVEFRQGRLEYVDRGKHEPDVSWTVAREYLQKIVDDPEPYVEHPEKLDWEWIKSRVGI